MNFNVHSQEKGGRTLKGVHWISAECINTRDLKLPEEKLQPQGSNANGPSKMLYIYKRHSHGQFNVRSWSAYVIFVEISGGPSVIFGGGERVNHVPNYQRISSAC